MLYEFMDRYIWHDFTNDILSYTKKESKSPIVVFDIGCFIGNFSRKLLCLLVNFNIKLKPPRLDFDY